MFAERRIRLHALSVAAVLVAGLVSQPQSAAAAMIRVDAMPSQSTVGINQQVNISITADISENILGFGFDLIFNTDLLAIANVSIAKPFLPLSTPDGDGLAGLAYPHDVIGSSIPLATVTLITLAPGQVEVGIGTTPGDPTEGFAEYGGGYSNLTLGSTANLTIIPTLGGGISVQTPEATAIPEPVTLSLLALGGLGFIRRR